MTALLLDNPLETSLRDGPAMSSWEIIDILSSTESMPFEKLKGYIDSLSQDQLQEFLEDLIYTKEISLTKKAMSFKILNLEYRRDLFPGKKGNGIELLWMYYSTLSSRANYLEWIKTRVWEIMANKKPTQYAKENVESILFGKPFTMSGAEIDEICRVLWIE